MHQAHPRRESRCDTRHGLPSGGRCQAHQSRRHRRSPALGRAALGHRSLPKRQKNGFAARYRWYYETIVAAYETYGLTFDFISPDANETDHADVEWLLYFASHLRHEPDPPYNFGKIRLVASDEVGSCTIAEEMLRNERLRNAIDVIGLHYTTYGDANTKRLHEEFGKAIWYSEGAAPCNIPSLTCRLDGSGLSGANGPIDIANRIIGGFPHGRMVMYEFQPAVNAYYDGACYAPKQLLTANTPWSGYYSIDIGLWTARHFTKFADPGWMFVDSACFGDGKEDHVISDTNDNYMTLCSRDGKHLTMILTNDSETPRSYLVVVRGFPNLPNKAYLIETIGNNDPDLCDVDWFHATDSIRLTNLDGECAFPLVVKPHSILTVTTAGDRIQALYGDEELTGEIPEHKRLPLPYEDNFRYAKAFVESRGGAPLYLTDQGGAFELTAHKGTFVLEQKITHDARPTNWRFRGTPEPLTCFGDDTWTNYQAITEAEFAEASPENYIGVGIRYNSAVTFPETSQCGLTVRLYADGKWEMRCGETVLADGQVPDFQFDSTHKIGIGAIGTLVMCFADGHSLYETKLDGNMQVRAGRASLCSAYYRNRFYSLKAEPMQIPIPMPLYVRRTDVLSDSVRFDEEAENGWLLRGMADYQHFNRTCAEGTTGSALEIRFYGDSIFLLGKNEYATCRLWLDEQLYSERYLIQDCQYREVFLAIEQLHPGWHTLRLEVTDGKLLLDVYETPTNELLLDADLPEDPRSDMQAKPKPSAFDLRKAAVPLAGIAAGGLAAAFTIGQFGKMLGKLQKRLKK